MTFPLPGRAAVLGLVVLAAPVGPVAANDWFRSHCSPKGCTDTQRVVIPGQQVEVVRETPRVVVREVAPAREMVSRSIHHRAAEVVPINTVYMPLTLPVFPAVTAAPASREICTTGSREIEESNPLEAIHRAELAAYRSEKAQRELQHTAELHQRSLSRFVGTGLDRGVTRAPDTSAAIEAKLAKIESEMARLNERLTSVERLLLYHDNYITQQAGRGVPPIPPATPSTVPPGPAQPPAGDASRAGPAVIPNIPSPFGTAPATNGPPPMLPPR